MTTTLDLLPYVKQNSDAWMLYTKGANSLFKTTASRVPNIIGVGYDSPYTQYLIDKGDESAIKKNEIGADFKQRGHEDEDAVVDRFVDWMGPLCKFWVTRCGTYAHPQYPWFGASPDRRIYFPATGTLHILEAKSKQSEQNPDADLPSDNHYVQIQCQLACVPQAVSAYYVQANVRNLQCENPLCICEIKRDEELFRNFIMPRVERHLNAVAGIGPVPPKRQTDKASTVQRIEESKTKHIILLYPPSSTYKR
jgi:hypothetical protein